MNGNAPPHASLMQLASAASISRTFHVLADLGIADLVKDGPKEVAELAEKTNTHAESLYRILRAAASVGLFEEVDFEKHSFRNTPMSEYLLEDHPRSLRAFVRLMGLESHFNSIRFLRHSVDTGETSLEKSVGNSNFFDYIQDKSKGEFEIFSKAMTSLSNNVHRDVLAAYDFKRFGTIADIGGGLGALLSLILQSSPELKGILYDLPHVVADPQEIRKNESVNSRTQVIGGSFFESVPPGADAYIASCVLHDWSDEKSLTILKNIHTAMPDNGFLLLIESVIPKDNKPHNFKFIDLIMLTAAGGKERTEGEWHDLLDKGGFKINRIVPTEGAISVIEAVKK